MKTVTKHPTIIYFLVGFSSCNSYSDRLNTSQIRLVYVFLNSTFTCFRERKHDGKATSLSIRN